MLSSAVDDAGRLFPVGLASIGDPAGLYAGASSSKDPETSKSIVVFEFAYDDEGAGACPPRSMGFFEATVDPNTAGPESNPPRSPSLSKLPLSSILKSDAYSRRV
jgi:hypothetical protein